MPNLQNIQISKLYRDESGSILIEFAVSSLVMLTVIFGILDCCRAIYAEHFVANAARNATRYAMVRGYTWTGTSCSSTTAVNCFATASDIAAYIQSTVPTGVTLANVSVNTTWPGTSPAGGSCYGTSNASPGCVVTTNIHYPFNFLFPFMPKNAFVLTSTSSVAIQQ
ncbi:TadE-like protein [Granulicella rosea]|uniref:TadE-like protein n=1 Tax=Granulicella rosea TaxID=474952 RepID=A0A239IJL6_9BACT|nr:TadE/TadG family type IV pilus assembly protein [Granulicella rosea]SNS93956.1 TadE-like protein [Granulicella rosea]